MVGEDRPGAPPDAVPADAPPMDGADEALPAGAMVGKYDIVEVLGQGGFGITYRARDARLDRDVAIKEYLPTSFARRHGTTTVLPRSTRTAEDFLWGRERFLDEAKTLARLENSAGIVNVYDYLEANGTAYMVMALVRGETLEARLQRIGRLPQPAIEQFFYPLLDGLERVHQAGFLHRDIKPANILLDDDGRPTLIDFGASRLALQGRTKAMTAVYTPGYAAYEQATSAPQGPWTDIYALAATLYQCVTGAPPPSALERMSDDTLVPAAEAGKARYAPSLLAAIDAGLKLKAADRPQSIADWRRVMAGQPVTAPTDAMTRRMDSPLTAAPAAALAPVPRRGRTRVWVAAGALALLVAAGGGWFVVDAQRRSEADAARKVAAEQAAEAARKAAAEKAAAEDKARADAEMRRRAEAAEAALRLTERDRYQVRLALTSLGFDAGSGDGVFGSRSRPMIAAWQTSRGFAATGFLSGPQLTALREQAAEALARDDERLKRQEEARRKAEQEGAARKAAEEKAAAETAARKAAEDKAATDAAARRKAEQEAAARKAAEEKAAAEAAARKAAEEKAAAEAAARRAAEEKAAAEARRKAEQEAIARKAAEEKAAAEVAARRKTQEAAWRAAAEESGRRAEEQARAETARRQAAEDKAAREAARRKAEQEAAARKVAEEKAAAEAAVRRAAEDKAAAEAKRKAEEDARKAADDRAKAAAGRQQVAAAEAALALTERDRRQVRVALKSLGFDGGLGDAPFGDRSRPMIAAWQKSRGFDGTGYLTGPQLAALRQQAAAAIARDEAEQKQQLDAKRKAEEDAKRQAAPPPGGGDLLAAWPSFQGCLISTGGGISGGGTRYTIVQRKVCFTGGGGRYELTLDNGMVCSAAARKAGNGVGFAVERQTCSAPTTGNPQFTWINSFDAPCAAGKDPGTLACRTNYSNGSTGGPYVFRRP
jgi:peptidoglycan hydrolase-like protein with peptidoglycan-binding domain